ncbi:sugar transporter [Erythrobacter insulae]|uniref:Sugar transporter n=1 Tax=Erythrobacter insulae TaxID=2584124 RepID=A0A547PCM1_9SPHN|nr:MFS transporter [Erythrobacter insulae]TRD11883.1 sugar transporter [Erythrobacter insulae]
MSLVPGKLPLRLKLIHGFGAVAFGVKDTGFSFFLLLFYNQVLGMEAWLVSLALLIALLVDAVVDPILGNLSDRTYTKWGRRLPWLYAAPIPLAFAWVLLWSPPGGEAPSFLGLVGIAVVVRILLSACEVPSISLLPEITSDYVERTTLFRYRYLSGWLGGLFMMVLAYSVFLSGENGLLQREGYFSFGLFGGILMVISVMGSAIGQHKLVANLPATKPPPFSIKACFAEIYEAFSEKAFLIFAAGGLAAYISQGMSFSMSNYLNVFVWRLDATPLGEGGATMLDIYPLALFLSVIVMFFIVGPLHHRLGKPKSAAMSAIGSLVILLSPYGALLAGIWPDTGTFASAMLLYALLIPGNALAITVMISASSMIAEIVEAYQERTGKRAEGAFYSGNWLVQKCATGVGIFLSGQFLSLAQLSPSADPTAVPQSVIADLVVYFGIATVLLALIAAYWLGRFPINREDHEARVAAMNAAAMPAPVEPSPPIRR